MLEHWNTWAHGHARLGSPLIFYPVLGTLGYSDALAGMGLVHIGLRALGLPVFTAMNVQLVLLSLASFGCAYAFLVRGFRLGVLGATAGGYFFAFSWPRFAQLVHVQLEFTFELPLLALLALECLRDGATLSRSGFAWRLFALLALLALTMATTVYYAEFFVLFSALALLASLLYRPARLHYGAILKRHWSGLLAGLVLAAILAVPIARIYLPVLGQSGGRHWDMVRSQLLDPIDLVWLGREHLAWGWLFERWPEWSSAKWPDKRLGVGVVATLAWIGAIVWAARSLRRLRSAAPPRNDAVAALLILAAALIQIAALRFGPASLWWLIFETVPGMNGLRAIGRIQLVAALPIALGFAILIDRGLRTRRRAWLVACLVGLAAIEQIGLVQRYSGRDAEALSRRVATAIPRDCKAAYVLGTLGMIPPPPLIENESQFDAAAYLAANPDLAANLRGSAWQHYLEFGRNEHRSLDPAAARYRTAMMFFYNYTIPLGATLAAIPVVNGLSGWQPPGWDLFDVFAPDAPARMAQWMRLNHRDPAEICVVRLDMPWTALPAVELRDH